MSLCRSCFPCNISSLNYESNSIAMNQYPSVSFAGDWNMQNDSFYYSDAIVTYIWNTFGNIWHFSLDFPPGTNTIPVFCRFLCEWKSALSSWAGWGVKIYPPWCWAKWVTALFTTRAVGWLLVSIHQVFRSRAYCRWNCWCDIILKHHDIQLAQSLQDILMNYG